MRDVEPLEHVGEIFGRDAPAVVGDSDNHPSVVVAHRDDYSCLGELQRVLQEVREHLSEPVAIDDGHR